MSDVSKIKKNRSVPHDVDRHFHGGGIYIHNFQDKSQSASPTNIISKKVGK